LTWIFSPRAGISMCLYVMELSCLLVCGYKGG
jgi:hypothetical protein